MDTDQFRRAMMETQQHQGREAESRASARDGLCGSVARGKVRVSSSISSLDEKADEEGGRGEGQVPGEGNTGSNVHLSRVARRHSAEGVHYGVGVTGRELRGDRQTWVLTCRRGCHQHGRSS